MSELLEGIKWTPPPGVVREAAVVLLVRGREVFWVRRGPSGFSAGYHAFPGGKVDKADGTTPIVECPPGDEAHRVAAIRETFEETGILLVPDPPPHDRLATLRKELLAGTPFATILKREGIRLDGSVLVPAGRWMTPDFSPVRYDTFFYVAQAPGGVLGEVQGEELASGAFVRPEEALLRWESGSALLHPPTHHALATLASRPLEAAVPLLRAPPFVGADHVARRLEFQRGILMVPLRTPTLPPATHTNAYVVGTGDVAVIDPGAADPAELLELLQELVDEGRRIKCVLLTHHHADHVGGAAAVAARFQVPVWASPGTAERVPVAEARLHDGEALELEGPRPFRLRFLLTEGHARGHTCFLDEATSAVICGDMVATSSTIVIDPPEGDMGTYLASLRRLRELPAGTLYPAHGLPIAEGARKLDEYLAHREARIQAIRASLPGTVAAIVERVYTDVPAFIHPVAERSAMASLIELERRGQARRSGEGWIPAEGP